MFYCNIKVIDIDRKSNGPGTELYGTQYFVVS